MKPRHKSIHCPERDEVFDDNRHDGIEAHWRTNHEHLMPFRQALPLIRNGTYRRAGDRRALSPCASSRYWNA